jgi:hypothetical protein
MILLNPPKLGRHGQAGYNTMSFLARVLVTSDELSDHDQNLAIETAIDEIVKENVSGVYKKVSRTVEDI